MYSIDERFLDFTGIKQDLVAYGKEIKETVTRWTGFPIYVGHRPQQDLGEAANHCAKKEPAFQGICDFTCMSKEEMDSLLQKLAVSSVWGIGRGLEKSLNALGVKDVLHCREPTSKEYATALGLQCSARGTVAGTGGDTP